MLRGYKLTRPVAMERLEELDSGVRLHSTIKDCNGYADMIWLKRDSAYEKGSDHFDFLDQMMKSVYSMLDILYSALVVCDGGTGKTVAESYELVGVLADFKNLGMPICLMSFTDIDDKTYKELEIGLDNLKVNTSYFIRTIIDRHMDLVSSGIFDKLKSPPKQV